MTFGASSYGSVEYGGRPFGLRALSISDAVGIGDVIVRDLGRSLADASTVVDAISRSQARVVTDSISIIDSPVRDISKSPADSISFTDNIGRTIVKYPMDTTNLVDGITRNLIRDVNDSISFSDSGGAYTYFRRQITINNNSGGALTDHQVKLTITYDSDMQSDFDDLRFRTMGDVNIPFWLESKIDSTSAIVWVKVDLPNFGTSPTGDNYIYMYYGDPALSSASSGTDTFEFFDDFNRANNPSLGAQWTEYGEYGSELFEINNNTVFRPQGSVGNIYAALATGYGIKTDITLRSKVKVTTFADIGEHFGIIVRSNTDMGGGHLGYYLQWEETITNLVLGEGYRTTKANTAIPTHILGDWWWFELQIIGTAAKGKVWKVGTDEPIAWDLTASVTSVASGYVGLYTSEWGTSAGNYDDFLVRKYASPEPTHSATGSEEYPNSGIVRDITRIVLDVGTIVDSVLKNIGLSVTDSLSIIDIVGRNINKPINDSISNTDIIIKNISKPINDSISNTDIIIKNISKPINDSIGTTDTISRTIGKYPTESVGVGDSIGRAIGRTVEDTVTMVESIPKKISRIYADVVGIIDSIKKSLYILWSTITIEDPYYSTIIIEDPYYSTITYTY